MARTTTITDEQILDAARELFMEHGMAATTSEIAKHAGISEGSIFRRFPSKDDLFIAAMNTLEPPFFGQLQARVGQGDLNENLTEIGTELLRFMCEMVPKIMLIASKGFQIVDGQDPKKILPVRGIMALRTYFEAEIEAGRLRAVDSDVLARAFVGSLHHYAFAEACGINQMLPMPVELYVQGVVDLILNGAGGENA